MPPLILTLKLDADSFSLLDALRKQHFPPDRNVLSAHLTLFHALPGENEAEISAQLVEIAARTEVLALNFSGARFLGKGVAIEVDSPRLVGLRRELSALWKPFLSAQDAQTIRPHVTIQNKVNPDEARPLFERTKRTWKPFEGRGEGFSLWRYMGGPWEKAHEFNFSG
ncbi:MAG TPA: 2'-5' RNA ligase family protein [Abditibacterium sp.]